MLTKYTKADLLWEATRRNQNYINQYNFLKKQYIDEKTNLLQQKIADLLLWYDSSLEHEIHSIKNGLASLKRIPGYPINWKIILIGHDHTLKNHNQNTFKSRYEWLDPNVKIDEIKSELKKPDADPLTIHPYYCLFNIINPENLFYHSEYLEKKPAESLEEKLSSFPSDKLLSFFPERTINGEVNICIPKRTLGDHALFMFNPRDSSANIQNTLIKIKNKILEKINPEPKHIIIKSSEIDTYIEYLRKYGRLVNKIKKKIETGEITTETEDFKMEKGAIILTDEIDFRLHLPDFTQKEEKQKFETVEQKYRLAYQKAVQLIQATPNVVFKEGLKSKRK
jgi:hypothetical protein